MMVHRDDVSGVGSHPATSPPPPTPPSLVPLWMCPGGAKWSNSNGEPLDSHWSCHNLDPIRSQ